MLVDDETKNYGAISSIKIIVVISIVASEC